MAASGRSADHSPRDLLVRTCGSMFRDGSRYGVPAGIDCAMLSALSQRSSRTGGVCAFIVAVEVSSNHLRAARYAVAKKMEANCRIHNWMLRAVRPLVRRAGLELARRLYPRDPHRQFATMAAPYVRHSGRAFPMASSARTTPDRKRHCCLHNSLHLLAF